jgi:hypothetical protein
MMNNDANSAEFRPASFTKIYSIDTLVSLSSSLGRKYLDFSPFSLAKNSKLAGEEEDDDNNVLLVMQKIGNDTIGIRFSGSKISAPEICKLLLILLTSATVNNSNRLTNLRYLDVSFISLSPDSFEAICSMVHPTRGTYSIKVLILSKCSLGTSQVSKLFQSLCGNNIIEEIIVTGNYCGDTAVPHIVSFLLEYKNIVTKLGIGGNKITSKGKLDHYCS